jgi:serine/threonine protein kinase
MFPKGSTYRDYKLLSDAHAGSYGQVYEAMHTKTKKQVAIKFTTFPHDPKLYLRFKQENTVLHKLKPHENLVTPYSNVVHDGTYAHYTMEYIEINLEDLLAQLPTSDTAARIELFKQICAGLQHAHSLGIFHRDLHPQNIRIDQTSSNKAKLSDFGLGKFLEGNFKSSKGLEIWGYFVKPPEVQLVISDDPTDALFNQGDIYALGLIFAFMFIPGLIPYVLSIRASIDSYLQGIGTGLFDDYVKLDEQERLNHYRKWLGTLNPNIMSQLDISLVDVALAKKLTEIVKKMCSFDIDQRYPDVASVVKDVEGL